MINPIAKRLERINNVLFLNASFIDNLGLLHGKMGICIYFFHLAKTTGKSIYKDYSNELINEISDEISDEIPVNFENGLAGIGWGIEYLVQNNFLEADTDDILEELDDRINHELIHHTPQDIGLLNGVIGLGFYYIKRIAKVKININYLPKPHIKESLSIVKNELVERLTKEEILKVIKEPFVNNGNKYTETQNQTFFNITWEYTSLLWFLAELLENNVFCEEIEGLVQQLIAPLQSNSNHPRLNCNRLLLSLALTKLNNSENVHFFNDNISKIIHLLISDVERDEIEANFRNYNTISFQKSVMDIVWIYTQLYNLTRNENFNNEKKYWITRIFNIEEVDSGYAGFNIDDNNKLNSLGIFEGLCGIGLNCFDEIKD